MESRVTTKEELIKRVLEQQGRLSFFGVRSIGLFGSFARGEQTDSSDIDILVEFHSEKHTFDNFMEVSFLLEEILGRKVEVVTPEGLSPHIGPHILKEVERVPVAI
ncbi:MAG: nucleotidyltransferase family protein [Desulfosalsimonas sp.]|uniref:nucleotidyltransferase family protein n=1 Tax=Desulfosalsimonas sp. TaxID=3073848 RepID=UPI003970B479